MKKSQHAIRAASSRWGRWATSRYLINNSVPFGLYRLAKQLAAATKGGF